MLVGIFATGRNGSTLLMRLLDGSPDLWVHPIDVNYLSVFSDLLKYGRVNTLTSYNATTAKPLTVEGELDVNLLLNVFSGHLQEIEKTYINNLTEPVVARSSPLRAIKEVDKYSSRTFLPAFLKSVRSAYDDRSCNPRHYVFKSIETPYIEEYSDTYPEMRFVHMIRHPFTNYSSLKRTNMITKQWPFWRHGGDELRTFLEKRWIPHARFLVRACTSGSDRHILVRYEDLCDKPEETNHHICRWLGVAPPGDPTLQTVLGGKRMIELPRNASKKGVQTPSRVIANMAEKFGYDDVLTIREKEFILNRTYDLARELGYFAAGEEVTLPNRLDLARKWFLPDQWELVNAQSKLGLAKALLVRRCYIYSRLLFRSP